ncbi:MAG: helix-turn-helix domain-containing protein [Pseudomonadota bacterium]
MPSKIDIRGDEKLLSKVQQLSLQLRQRRKALGVSTQSAAAAAGLSRDTWYRMEQGAATVTIAAWFRALEVLGLRFGLELCDEADLPELNASVPLHIPLSDYPQLAALAWQIRESTVLSPREAFDVYERNQRHLNVEALDGRERVLLDNLRQLFGQ